MNYNFDFYCVQVAVSIISLGVDMKIDRMHNIHISIRLRDIYLCFINLVCEINCAQLLN